MKEDAKVTDACVDIKHPYTEEGKPACMSSACPKNSNCKVCCKDWREP